MPTPEIERRPIVEVIGPGMGHHLYEDAIIPILREAHAIYNVNGRLAIPTDPEAGANYVVLTRHNVGAILDRIAGHGRRDRTKLNEKGNVVFTPCPATTGCCELVVHSPKVLAAVPVIERFLTIQRPYFGPGQDFLSYSLPGYNPDIRAWQPHSAIIPMLLPLDEARAHWPVIVENFGFASLGALSNAFAMFITLYCRLLFRGPSPVFIITANTMRAGKDAWVTIVHITYTGSAREFGWTGKEEDKKTIFANALEGATTMHFSNINSAVNLTVLERIATAQVIVDRVLKESRTAGILNEILFSLSGNSGFVLGGDMAPRCIRIPLFVPDADPNARILARASIPAWAEANRLINLGVAAAATAAWVEAGCPPPTGRFNSFPDWFRVVGGITQHFLGEPLDLASTAVFMDPTTADFNRLLAIIADPQSPLAAGIETKSIPAATGFPIPALRELAEAMQKQDAEFLPAFRLNSRDDGIQNAAQQAFARFSRARVGVALSLTADFGRVTQATLTKNTPEHPRPERQLYSVRYVNP
jgi:hypothetical protein